MASEKMDQDEIFKFLQEEMEEFQKIIDELCGRGRSAGFCRMTEQDFANEEDNLDLLQKTNFYRSNKKAECRGSSPEKKEPIHGSDNRLPSRPPTDL